MAIAGIYARDTVQWDRCASTLDSQENQVLASVSGFPMAVLCRFHVARFSSAHATDGAKVRHDAVVYSASFLDGQVGDRVLFRGIGYVVIGASPRSYPLTTGISFVRYDLAKVTGASS